MPEWGSILLTPERDLLIDTKRVVKGVSNVGERMGGTPGGIRTPDPLVRSQMLCPLSYGRTDTLEFARWSGVDGGNRTLDLQGHNLTC